ncbi:hypothetical protein BLOT_008601 [Blomia tropicalis]|nr:hypothetical protein BLOT_008601 [Blomia tropicalis]
MKITLLHKGVRQQLQAYTLTFDFLLTLIDIYVVDFEDLFKKQTHCMTTSIKEYEKVEEI